MSKPLKRTLVKAKGYTTEQKFWTFVLVIAVICYILLGGYTQASGVFNLMTFVIQQLPTPAR